MFNKGKDEYIIIIGCGRLGGSIANLLSKEGKSIVIIDKKESSFTKLSDDFSGFTLEANAIELDTLLRAKIDKADVVVAATNDDNTNIMIAQIAKLIYKVPKVITRLYEPAREEVYKNLDIDTICPTNLSALEFKNIIINNEGKVENQ